MRFFKDVTPPFFEPKPLKKRYGSLAVYYYVSKKSSKYVHWKDGFVAAMEILSQNWEIHWIHAGRSLPVDLFQSYDAILVKSNWNWKVDKQIQRWGKLISSPLMLLLSGSIPPPEPRKIHTYAHVFYETNWYAALAEEFPSSSRAFGVNTNIYRAGSRTKKWDVLGIGAFRNYKRWDMLAKKQGKKAIVGERTTAEAKHIATELEKKGVQTFDFMAPEKLRELILSSKKVYIPASLQGGGERAVWEAKASGVPVEVAEDNPKLVELASNPVQNQEDYAHAIQTQLKTLVL
jgi:hypothetical protein